MQSVETKKKTQIKKSEVLADYALAIESREASLIGRKEVFMGKAKFGIFGDGKEIAQIAVARAFENGDWRSGYYRDQTFMMALGQHSSQEFFAQMYAHTDVEAEPASAGRMMNGHFGTRSNRADGEWEKIIDIKNSCSDISPTAAQIPRLVGLAYASKLYRQNPDLHTFRDFSINGNEVAFGTIGNGATSEGHFFEAVNAAGVLQIPMVLSVWDDAFAISVPQQYHTTKESISRVLSGFQRNDEEQGLDIYVVKGWDYPALRETYAQAARNARLYHIPSVVHVEEMTQPLGHSTSGSHERYKSKERLEWEKEFDCIAKMREWILNESIAQENELDDLEKDARAKAKSARDRAWKAYTASIKGDFQTAIKLIKEAAGGSANKLALLELHQGLRDTLNPLKSDIMRAVRKAVRYLKDEESEEKQKLVEWIHQKNQIHREEYNSHLYSESRYSPVNVEKVEPHYTDESPMVDGREVIQACFDDLLSRDPRVFAIGEDIGIIGDVNQGFAGLQEKHGELRVTDTGIRELSIVGQGIGSALRGLRPIVEIQYLDYVIYALQTLSDDLASLHYRMKGGQKAPVIIRTRGHRLEGVWHSGSPMSMILGSLRGIYLLVPRNFTQAAGFYNTLMDGDNPALVVEPLNAYRLKEKMPANIGDLRTPLGIPEILREGQDITLVTYGSMCRIVQEAAQQLSDFGISCEVIDVQSLLPFDIHGVIAESIKKTSRVAFIDEDVPGGASAFMMQNALDRDSGYQYLDSKPIAISAKEHRPAYSTDGDYFSKPNTEDIFEAVYDLLAEADPKRFKPLY